MERTKIINQIIQEKGYKTYLEIGLGDGHNFKNVILDDKGGVDPNVPESIQTGWTKEQESSEFFDWYVKECSEDAEAKRDLIFIDGLHLSEQCEADIVNSWKCLNPGGSILIHDCMPWDEIVASRDRKSVAWTGDVYKCVVGLVKNYTGKIKMKYYPERAGLFLIEKPKTRLAIKPGFSEEISYQEFDKNWKSVIKAL